MKRMHVNNVVGSFEVHGHILILCLTGYLAGCDSTFSRHLRELSPSMETCLAGRLGLYRIFMLCSEELFGSTL